MSLYRLADGLKDHGPKPDLDHRDRAHAQAAGADPEQARHLDAAASARARIAEQHRKAGIESWDETVARLNTQADPETTARLVARFDLRARGIDPDQLDAYLLSYGIDPVTLTPDRKPRTWISTDRDRKRDRFSIRECPFNREPVTLPAVECDCGITRHLEKGGVERSVRLDGRCRHCGRCGPRIAVERSEAFARLLAELSLGAGWWLVTVTKKDQSKFGSWRNRQAVDIVGISTPTDREGTRVYLLWFGDAPPPNRYGTTEAISDPQKAHDQLIEATHALAKFEHSVGQPIGQTSGIGSWESVYAAELAAVRADESGWRSVGIATNADRFTLDEKRAKVVELGGNHWRTSPNDLCAQFPTDSARQAWRAWLGVIPDDELAERRRVKKLAVAEWDRINDPALYTAA